MTIPRLCLVADGVASGRAGRDAEALAARVLSLVAAGVPWVALRDIAAADDAFLRAAGRLAERLRALRPDVVLSVHGRLDAATALGAIHHATRHGETVGAGVAAGRPVGASVHTPAEAAEAARQGAAYVFVSPVWPTATHPAAPAAGVDALRATVGAAGVPVLALGGVEASRVAEARAAGAHGVAAVSALLDAPDGPATVATFLRALDP